MSSVLPKEEPAPKRQVKKDACAAPPVTSVIAPDIRAQLLHVLTSENKPTTKGEESARTVVAALKQRGNFYYHSELRNFDSAMYFNSETKRLLYIRSDEFCAWLSNWISVNRTHPIFNYIKTAVENASLSEDSKGMLPEMYWANRSDAVYLSNGDGRVVKITAGKVELCDNGVDGVLFQAGQTLPVWTLTEPQDPTTTCALFRDAKFADKYGMSLLRLFVLCIPAMRLCKPPFCFTGAFRSGKTRTIRGVFELYGLPFKASSPKDNDKSQSDFWVAMNAGGIYCLDNIDSKISWLADAVATASTGAGTVTRELYTTAREKKLTPSAWVALSTQNPQFASDSALADRLVVVRMESRGNEPSSDEALSKEISRYRNAGLSWVAKTLADALAIAGEVPEINKRHPDFSKFAVKLGRATGHEQEIITALKNAEADKSRFCLENSPVGLALLKMAKADDKFDGTASELLDKLATYDPDFGNVTGNFGKRKWTPKGIGRVLSFQWTHIQTLIVASRHEVKDGWSYQFAGLRV
jgi:hypothetical protein